MLEITEAQMGVIDRDAAARGIDDVVACMLDVHPDWRLAYPPPRLRELALDWIGYARRFGIERVANVCTLFEVEQRWGGFGGDDARWIVEVLEGPLDEDDKLAYLDEVLHGG